MDTQTQTCNLGETLRRRDELLKNARQENEYTSYIYSVTLELCASGARFPLRYRKGNLSEKLHARMLEHFRKEGITVEEAKDVHGNEEFRFSF